MNSSAAPDSRTPTSAAAAPSPLGFLWQATRRRRWHYLLMLLAPLSGAFYEPAVFYAVKRMVDLLGAQTMPALALLGPPLLLYLGAEIVVTVIWRSSQVASWRSQPLVRQGIVVDALARLLAYPLGFFQNAASGSLLSRVKGLVDGHDALWDQLYFGLSYWVLATLAAAASIIWADSGLGALVLAWALPTLLLNLWLGRISNRLSRAAGDARHRVFGVVGDILSNVPTVKLFAARRREAALLSEHVARDWMPAQVVAMRFNMKVALVNDVLSLAFIIAMLGSMIWLRAHGRIGLGDFVFVFSMVFALQRNLFHMIQEFQALAQKMGDLKSSLALLAAADSEYPEPAARQPGPALDIAFDDVGFAFADGRSVFSGLNLRIRAGEKIGIVGHTGAGKTTLVNLLLGVFRPQQGRISVGGVDVADLDPDALRSRISVMPQDITLFQRDVRANIAYGKPDASDAEVRHASRRAHAAAFIEALPAGYAALVGERGVKFSGGQRQRIAIARALLKDAPILILDEATSSLDSETEAQIQAGLAELLQGRTVLAIAHRLSTLRDMDRLIVLEHGAVVESGTHDELLADPTSRYARLWRAQQGGQLPAALLRA